MPTPSSRFRMSRSFWRSSAGSPTMLYAINYCICRLGFLTRRRTVCGTSSQRGVYVCVHAIICVLGNTSSNASLQTCMHACLYLCVHAWILASGWEVPGGRVCMRACARGLVRTCTLTQVSVFYGAHFGALLAAGCTQWQKEAQSEDARDFTDVVASQVG